MASSLDIPSQRWPGCLRITPLHSGHSIYLRTLPNTLLKAIDRSMISLACEDSISTSGRPSIWFMIFLAALKALLAGIACWLRQEVALKVSMSSLVTSVYMALGYCGRHLLIVERGTPHTSEALLMKSPWPSRRQVSVGKCDKSVFMFIGLLVHWLTDSLVFNHQSTD